MINESNKLIENFMLLKHNPDNLLLENDIIQNIINLFEDGKLKQIKNYNSKYNNLKPLVKNSIIQNKKKDSLINKINLILNKLTTNNINNLILDFITNINYISNIEFNDILKIFYLKILNDINFIKIYLEFLKSIVYIYNNVFNYTFEFFINIIEIKFYIDYLDYNITELDIYNDIIFLESLNTENKRFNNLVLIKKLVEYNFLSNDLLLYCDDIIVKQKKYLTDIYYWYTDRKNILTKSNINILEDLLITNNLPIRDKILLQNLIKED